MLTTNRFSSRQAYGTCLCPERTRWTPARCRHSIASPGVVDDVALAPGARHRQQVVVEHEDLELRRLRGELLLDPAVATASDLTVVEVGLGRVDRDDGDAVLAEHRVALAEELLEVDVADVARVVVARDDDERVAVDAGRGTRRASWYSCLKPNVVRSPEQTTMSGWSSLISAIARSSRVASKYGPPQWRSRSGRSGRRRSPRPSQCAQSDGASWRGPSEAARYPRDGAGDAHGIWLFQAYRGSEPPRFANGAELECAQILDYYGVPWEYEPHSFVLERDAEGRVTSAFTPDFYLPEQDLYIEVTVMKQSLVTRKNRKLREVQQLYPDVTREALLPARHRAPRAALPAAARLVSALRSRAPARGRPADRRASTSARDEIAARVAELGREIAAAYAGSTAAPRRAAQVERRVPRRPLTRARARPHARRDRARAVRQRPRGWRRPAARRTSTRRSRDATCSSSRTSSTPG